MTPPVIVQSRERTAWVWPWVSGLGVLGAGAVLYWFDPASHGFYPRCLFHEWTGLHCPGCGSLRALHQLSHGHLGAAFGSNPLLILALPFLGWIMAARLLRRFDRSRLARNPRVGAPTSSRLWAIVRGVSRLEVGAPTGSWPVSKSGRSRELPMPLPYGVPPSGCSRAAERLSRLAGTLAPPSPWTVLAVVLVFTVLRNLPFPPFTMLAP